MFPLTIVYLPFFWSQKGNPVFASVCRPQSLQLAILLLLPCLPSMSSMSADCIRLTSDYVQNLPLSSPLAPIVLPLLKLLPATVISSPDGGLLAPCFRPCSAFPSGQVMFCSQGFNAFLSHSKWETDSLQWPARRYRVWSALSPWPCLTFPLSSFSSSHTGIFADPLRTQTFFCLSDFAQAPLVA